MPRISVELDEAAYAQLASEAGAHGVDVETAAQIVLRAHLAGVPAPPEVVARAQETVEELLSRPSDVDEDEAMRIAREEVDAMRAERRARRP